MRGGGMSLNLPRSKKKNGRKKYRNMAHSGDLISELPSSPLKQ